MARGDGGQVPLRVLHTVYASVVQPICAFINELRRQHDEQIVVLIPVVSPEQLRYRLLHNGTDHVLSRALRSPTDVIVARVQLPLEPQAPERNRAEPVSPDKESPRNTTPGRS